MPIEHHYNRELHLGARLEALWPFVADTGLPEIERLSILPDRFLASFDRQDMTSQQLFRFRDRFQGF